MDFIKQMKKREFIEMGIKTLAAVLAVFLVVLLMEGMIYSIKLNSLVKGAEIASTITTTESKTVAYCIEKEDDKYLVLFHLEDKEADMDHWFSTIKTKAECTEKNLNVNKIIYDEPNAFDLAVEGWHFIIMGVIVAAVAGYFTYRFIRLNQSYKKIEEQFLKDGTIEITNVALEN